MGTGTPRRIAWLGALVALALAAPAGAEELTAKELQALAKVERELLGLAGFAAKGRDIPAALIELKAGLTVWPEAPRLPAEIERFRKLADRAGTPKPDFAAQLAKKREAAYAKVAAALADAALAVRETHAERFDRYVGHLTQRFPDTKALARLDLAYFAPYRSWLAKADVPRLEAGGELIDGKWRDRTEVAQLDEQHADWRAPWVLADEVHELRTTIPYRRAKQILCYVGLYRRWFLDQFAGLWDLQAPKGKLPVIVTATRREMEARMRETTGARDEGPAGAAFYLQTNGSLNPCFVSFEIVAVNGPSVTVKELDDILVPLTHELTHQICFEYSKHAYDDTRQVEHHFWCVEAFANHLGYYAFDGTAWRLRKPRQERSPDGSHYSEGPFYWCQANPLKVPPIADYVRIPKAQFSTVENYHIGATLSYFLIEGADGKYRGAYVKLLEAVHRVRDTADLFEKSFAGHDLAAMQKEFDAFVAAITLDE